MKKKKKNYMTMSTKEIGWTSNVTFGQYNFETDTLIILELF
jgi:hypothetical protein